MTRFETEGIKGLHTRSGQGCKPIMDCSDEDAVGKAIESDRQSVRSAKEAWQKSSGKQASELTFRRFFIRIGARYRRIRKRPRSVPSPQLYVYKTAKLQELEQLYARGEINLFYGDESHVCTEGYVRYGWQFPGENVYIPSERGKRLNIFGMIDRGNRFEGCCTNESINAQKVVDFLE